MLSTHQAPETRPPAHQPVTEPEQSQQPYAIIWMNGMEVLLFENEDGDFFTA